MLETTPLSVGITKKCQVLKIQYISSWVCIYRECTLTTETQKGKILVIPYGEAFINVSDLFSTPVTHSCCLFFFFSFEQTAKFQLNLVEDFQSNRKSCFQDSIRGPKKKTKKKKGIIRTVERSTQLEGSFSGGVCFSITRPVYQWHESPEEHVQEHWPSTISLKVWKKNTLLKPRKRLVHQRKCRGLTGTRQGRWQ